MLSSVALTLSAEGEAAFSKEIEEKKPYSAEKGLELIGDLV
jgi:hypothetical protein